MDAMVLVIDASLERPKEVELAVKLLQGHADTA
jgi:hypothetical protein